jgi:hypothetical protein
MKKVRTKIVEVYRNLHKNCWSVRNNATGHVLWHVDEVLLEDVDLVVRPAGRAKVLREKRKNVHAFAKGEIVETHVGPGNLVTDLIPYQNSQVVYNPYEHDSFVLQDTGERVTHAKHVYLNNKGKVFIGV